MPTRIKFCGITRREDALAAARLGVDAIGFVFHRKSPRYVDPGRAAAIVRELVTRGRTIVAATHDEEFAERAATRVIRMDNGRVWNMSDKGGHD